MMEINYSILYLSLNVIKTITLGEEMTNRESWEFTFAGAELLEAVKSQLSSLKVSLAKTKRDLADAQKAMNRSGFSFDAGGSSPKGDYRLAAKVNELQYRLTTQEKRQDELHRWHKLLSKNDVEFTEYQLKFLDHAFFFPEHHEHVVKAAVKPTLKPKTVKEKALKKEAVKTAPVAKPKAPEKVVEVVKVAKT